MAMVLSYGMKNKLVSIDQAGRIVLPKEVRDDLAIKPGDLLKVSTNGAAVTLTPSRESTGFIRKGNALVFSTRGDETISEKTVQEILESGRAERDSRNFERLSVRSRRR
jgi:AbrB family looped-hinge helix DNA binding protein